MSEIIKPIMTDETGLKIVDALMQNDIVAQKTAEISQAAEEKKDEVLASIPSDYTSLVNSVNSRLFVSKVYMNDYCKADGKHHTISEMDSSVTLEEVRKLSSGADLNSSYDWYILQKTINDAPDNTKVIFNGSYVFDMPIVIKRSNIVFKSEGTIGAAMSRLTYTGTDSNIDFITIGLLGSKQIQNIDFIGFKFYGTLSGENHSGNCVTMYNANGSSKSDCLNVNFIRCDFIHFKNGIYVKGAYYISSVIRDCIFSYCVENGFFGKAVFGTQINDIHFDHVGGLGCGMEYDPEANKWVASESEDKALINISGASNSITNYSTMDSANGIIINTGATQGLSINSCYFESVKKYDINIQGTIVTGLFIASLFTNRPLLQINSVDKTIPDKCIYDFLSDKFTDGTVKDNELSVHSFNMIKERSLIGNDYRYLFKYGDDGALGKAKINRCSKLKVSFDYKYSNPNAQFRNYAYLTLCDFRNSFLTAYYNNLDEFIGTYQITAPAEIVDATTITLDNPIPENVTDAYFKLIEVNEVRKLGDELMGATALSLNSNDLVKNADFTLSPDRRTIVLGSTSKANYVITWLKNPKPLYMTLIAKHSTDTTDTPYFKITGMYEESGTTEIIVDFNNDAEMIPVYKTIVKNIQLNIQNRMTPDQTCIISNIRIKEID